MGERKQTRMELFAFVLIVFCIGLIVGSWLSGPSTTGPMWVKGMIVGAFIALCFVALGGFITIGEQLNDGDTK